MVLNGVSVQANKVLDDEMTQFAGGLLTVESFKRGDPFWRELACLNGLGNLHFSEMMDTAFNLEQEITFDTVHLGYAYSI